VDIKRDLKLQNGSMLTLGVDLSAASRTKCGSEFVGLLRYFSELPAPSRRYSTVERSGMAQEGSLPTMAKWALWGGCYSCCRTH